MSLTIHRNLLYLYVRYLKLDLLCRHVLLRHRFITARHCILSSPATVSHYKIYPQNLCRSRNSISLLSPSVAFSVKLAPCFIEFTLCTISIFIYCKPYYSPKYQLHGINRHQSQLRLIMGRGNDPWNRIAFSNHWLQSLISRLPFLPLRYIISLRDRTRDIN